MPFSQISAKCVSLQSIPKLPNMGKHIQLLQILAVAFLSGLVCSSCHNATPTVATKIDQLKQRVVDDSTTLYTLRTIDFRKLESDFQTCDAKLKDMAPEQLQAAFDKLNLTQAYLHQFKEVSPVMRQKIGFTLLQLDLLKADVESQYLADSLALFYLEDESKVADTLHNQVLYFKDRFNNCQNELNQLKKSQE